MAGTRLPGPTRETSRPGPRQFHRILPGSTRLADRWGHGRFGEPRGARTHGGLDIVAVPGEVVSSPIEGTITPESLPYADDASYRGLLISGTGPWEGYEVRMFYVVGFLSGRVAAGQTVGLAQDLGRRYPGITNHVHLEVRYHGTVLNPMDTFGLCF